MLEDGKHFLCAVFNDASETLQEQVCRCSLSGKTHVPQLKCAPRKSYLPGLSCLEENTNFAP